MRVEVDHIGMANAAEVAVLGRSAIERGDVEFDLSGVSRCDSSAVAVLLEWQRTAAQHGVTLKVSGLPPGLVSLAQVYGVADLLPGARAAGT
jgi:phospholipid transport system transporter-binding protein